MIESKTRDDFSESQDDIHVRCLWRVMRCVLLNILSRRRGTDRSIIFIFITQLGTMSLGDELLSVPFASALRGLWSHKYEFDGKHLSSIVFSHMIQHNADRNRWKGRRAIVKLIARCYSLTRNDSELDSNCLTVTLVVRHFSRPNFNYSNFDKTSLFSHKIAGNSILADALLSHFRCP